MGKCFETFLLPWPPGEEPTDDAAHTRISEAAKELNEQRERWLNPPEWIHPIAARIDAADDFADVPEEARPLIREPDLPNRFLKGKDRSDCVSCSGCHKGDGPTSCAKV